jgi:hypothetical protein
MTSKNALHFAAQGHMSCSVFFVTDARRFPDNAYGQPIRCTKNALHHRGTIDAANPLSRITL